MIVLYSASLYFSINQNIIIYLNFDITISLFILIARRGFSNYPFKQDFEVVSLDAVSEKYEDGEVVSLDSLKDKGLVKGYDIQAKVLANGELTKKVVFEGLKISATAIEKIKAAGGEIR
ncbi:MAG: uL15 family ribosomal protein [Sphaerochaetaceae bacterium]|nr:uL15 family ribosomal protein [Sphaerochaetaceae bacterium]